MRAFVPRLSATLRAMLRFLCLFSARLSRPTRRLARALRIIAASLRLTRVRFVRARLFSRLIAVRLRATADCLEFAVRVLRSPAANDVVVAGQAAALADGCERT